MSIEYISEVCYGITGLIQFLVHAFIMIFLLSVPQLRQRKSNQLLININVGHALTGITLFVMIFIKSNSLTYINYSGYAQGNMALVMLTIDRCIMIRWPFRYQTLPNLFHVIFMVSSPIVASVILVNGVILFPHQPSDDNVFYMSLFVYVMIVVMVVLLATNALVYATVLKQKRLIKNTLVASTKRHGDPQSNNIKDDILSFYICLGCVLTYILLWLPELVRQSLWVFEGRNTSAIYLGISRILLNLNPFFDAIILVWFNRELKMHLKKMFKRNKVVSFSSNSITLHSSIL